MPPTNYLHFTREQTREQIVNNILNKSTAKATYSFSKHLRFQPSSTLTSNIKFYSPSVGDKSTAKLKNHGYGFGKSKRKLFTEQNCNPSSWNYNPELQNSKKKLQSGIQFGEGRKKCISNSYFNHKSSIIFNPGPGQYEIKPRNNKNYKFTMRPKTSYQKTYFLENKQAMQVPGPGKYNKEEFSKIACKTITSKFRQTSLGGSAILSKTMRFKTDNDLNFRLTTSLYHNKLKSSWEKGCSIGSEKRKSFIDKIAKRNNQQEPGPGKYELPSEFGHYKKISSFSNGRKK